MAKKDFKKQLAESKQKRVGIPQIDPSGVQPAVIEKPAVAEKKVEKVKKAEPAADQLYTTYIRKDQKKKVKLHALEEDKHDKEIVQAALDEYFKNHPL